MAELESVLAQKWVPRAFAPHRDLAGRVRDYFSVEEPEGSRPWRLIPDGTVDLIFTITEGSGDLDAAVIGALTRPRMVDPGPGIRRFGVSFAIGEASSFLGAALHPLQDEVVDLGELLGSEARRLTAELRRLPTNERRVDHMNAFLLARAARTGRPPPFVSASIELLRQRAGAMSMRTLAAALGVTERSLQRSFGDHVGMTPKTLARILRLRATLEQASRQHSWTSIAHAGGFADQAHLNHEFRQLTGGSPRQLLGDRPLSDFYNSADGVDLRIGAWRCETDPGGPAGAAALFASARSRSR
jgi:AraC-like DNA-binding protein